MGALSAIFPTLLDVARATDPQGKIPMIAEVLQEYNDILDDIPWIEGNLPTGHLSVIRTSKPAGTWRSLNKGIQASKSTVGQITNTCGMLESLSHIDCDLASLNGNTEAFRFSQDRGHIEGLSDTMSDTLIYGNVSVDPEQFDGLASRYFSLGTTYTTSSQMIDGGGIGSDNTSIWLVGWAPNKVYGIYPKGSKAGLVHEDDGKITISDPNNSGYFLKVYQSRFQWKGGIAVDDYRYVVRICNIDVSALLTAGDTSDTSANIIKMMVMALGNLPPRAGVRPVFYMNKTVQTMLAVKMLDKSNVWLSVGEIKGSPVFRPDDTLKFQGVPCRRIDSILNTESRITTATTPS
ncbi:major capsid protein [Sulfuricurvum sp.]|uniref:major capsid protein n=1 Tax=Sulfuricurvum sp. TaxID=2025608 RepID=UPI0035676E0B